MDFAVLPPEVNSGRMYVGPGSGPMVAAAAAWDGLAAELSSATASYQGVVSELTGGAWQGPSAASMAAAAAPYLEWMGATAAQAEQAANQARAAVAAYETAYAATVPPPVIAANRTLLQTLVANNIFGQNTSAIAANQAQYGEMWAQDAAAMYGYAASSAAATQLTPFAPPKQNTNPAGQANQATAASNAGSAAASALQNLAAPAAAAAPGSVPGPIQSIIDAYLQIAALPLFSSMNQLAGSGGLSSTLLASPIWDSSAMQFLQFVGMLNAGGVNGTAWGNAAAALPAAMLSSEVSGLPAGALGTTLAGTSGSAASLGRAASVGGLSVPQSWASAAPAARLAASAIPGAAIGGVPAAGVGAPGGWMGGMPMLAGAVNSPRSDQAGSRLLPRLKVLPETGEAAGARPAVAEQWTPGSQAVTDTVDVLTDQEREEVNELRQEIAGLALERDAVAFLLREVSRP